MVSTTYSLAALAGVLLLGGCTETAGLVFTDTGILGGGFGSGGVAQAFGERLPLEFRYLYPPDAPGPFTCTTDFHCGLAGRTTAVGNMSNGGAILVFISTANVPAGQPGGPRTIRASGIRTYSGAASTELTVPDPAQYRELRLVLEWAFLTARFTPATFNDSAVVRIRAGTDSAVLLRVTSADLQSGRFPQKAGGCGTHEVVGRGITYGTCTDWQTAELDITPWKSRSFIFQFIVGEAGTPVTGTQDQPTAFLFRRVSVAGGR